MNNDILSVKQPLSTSTSIKPDIFPLRAAAFPKGHSVTVEDSQEALTPTAMMVAAVDLDRDDSAFVMLDPKMKCLRIDAMAEASRSDRDRNDLPIGVSNMGLRVVKIAQLETS